ncbi:hypothetical protein CYJ28_03260 [Aerococcus sanguinicola]|uniref:Uncharacterized protein n=1 Tax=Aerococcus sanguinicola TaxID=119206 RepID=A0A109RD64_9LACT|nr:hypothetical protein AWM72_04445 [Aerococcus sanguinicola]PKZ22150.1 hypothetical protein CYJ28_03260 [Aerococcus sanguinicola]
MLAVLEPLKFKDQLQKRNGCSSIQFFTKKPWFTPQRVAQGFLNELFFSLTIKFESVTDALQHTIISSLVFFIATAL